MKKNLNVLLFLSLLFLAAGAMAYFRWKVVPQINQHLAEQERQLQAGNSAESAAAVANTAQPNSQDSFSPEVALELKNLSSRQKLAQLLAYPVLVTNSASPLASPSAQFLGTEQPGFATIFGNRISSASAALAVRQLRGQYPASALKPIIAVDHEGGSVQRLSGTGFTRLPSWSSSCQASLPQTAAILEKSGQELATAGIDIVFGPVTDTAATSSSVLADRSCGAELANIEPYIKTWVATLDQFKIGSVLKHYPNLGELSVDLHDAFATVSAQPVDQKWMLERLADTSAIGVMTSHAGQPPDQNMPCSQSSSCLQPLRTKTSKLLFSDGLEMAAAKHRPADQVATTTEIAIAAFTAGNDVLVYAPQPNQFFSSLLDGLELRYNSDPAFRQVANAHLQRVVSYKLLRSKGSP